MYEHVLYVQGVVYHVYMYVRISSSFLDWPNIVEHHVIFKNTFGFYPRLVFIPADDVGRVRRFQRLSSRPMLNYEHGQ